MAPKKLSWFSRFWRGQLSLAKSFWVYGVVAIVLLWLAFAGVIYRIAMGGFGHFLFFSVLFISLLVGYQVLVSVGVWRSAGNYRGNKIWPILARSAVVLSGLWLGMNLWVMGQVLSMDSHDTTRNSANVATHIDRNPQYPFSGFWKGSCGENFGLVIEPSPNGNSNYSVSFCGPGGCFKPGTYRPDTSLTNDPEYRIIDSNTIEVAGRNGFSRYIRCR